MTNDPGSALALGASVHISLGAGWPYLPRRTFTAQLALAPALRRGVDPDRPPGLAKVTRTA